MTAYQDTISKFKIPVYDVTIKYSGDRQSGYRYNKENNFSSAEPYEEHNFEMFVQNVSTDQRVKDHRLEVIEGDADPIYTHMSIKERSDFTNNILSPMEKRVAKLKKESSTIHYSTLEKEIGKILKKQEFDANEVYFNDAKDDEYGEIIANGDDVTKAYHQDTNASAEIVATGFLNYLKDENTIPIGEQRPANIKRTKNLKTLKDHIELSAAKYADNMDAESDEDYGVQKQLQGKIGEEIAKAGEHAIRSSLVDLQDGIDHLLTTDLKKPINKEMTKFLTSKIKDSSAKTKNQIFDKNNSHLDRIVKSMC